jgi:hypothetical protein
MDLKTKKSTPMEKKKPSTTNKRFDKESATAIQVLLLICSCWKVEVLKKATPRKRSRFQRTRVVGWF